MRTPRLPAAPACELQRSVGNRAIGRLLQAKLSVSQPGAGHGIQRVCAECEEELQRKPADASEDLDERAGEIEPYIASLSGRGQPLPESTRACMEPRFGADFSRVRVHTDSDAAESAQAVDALAFTVGRDIVFGAGSYAPESDPGRRLLAHELTHVVQQGEGEAATHEGAARPVQRFATCEAASACPTRASGEAERSMRAPMFVGGVSGAHEGLLVANFAVGAGTLKHDLSSNSVWVNFWGQMVTNPHIRWEILGFSDCEGADAQNELLRWERAIAVNNALPQLARNQVDGFSAAPLADCMASNADEQGRTHNRSALIRQVSTAYTFEETALTGQQLKFPYSPELDPELATRFNRMVIAMDSKNIGHDSKIDDVRPRPRAHILSTAHHLHTKQAVPLSDLRTLADGKDLDGNTWYKKEWEQASTWGGFGEPRPATSDEILEKARANAFELAKGQGSGYVTGSEVNCAYEGYEPDDGHREPNVAAVPVSQHVTGGAIDLGGIEWDKLGGRWSKEAVEFVASFGLTRPFSPDAATYCIKEHWHFELGAQAPAESAPPPKEAKP